MGVLTTQTGAVMAQVVKKKCGLLLTSHIKLNWLKKRSLKLIEINISWLFFYTRWRNN